MECLRHANESVLESGNRLVKFEYEGIFEEVLDKLGQMPSSAVYHA